MRTRRVGAAFALAAAGGVTAAPEDFPVEFREPEGSRRRVGSLSAAIFLHGGALAILVFLASIAPMIDEEIIPVSLIRDEPDAPEPDPEPAPAPRALAERRSLNYAPAVQAVAPQIVNPHVIAEASPAIEAKALDMDAVSSVAAPTEITRASPVVVDRVSAVRSIATARASAVDVAGVGGPVVRGPIRADLPVGPSVGPRKVASATTGSTMGTGKLTIGGGSSVREGILSTRDVQGSPDGAPLVRVDTSVGEGYIRGAPAAPEPARPRRPAASACRRSSRISATCRIAPSNAGSCRRGSIRISGSRSSSASTSRDRRARSPSSAPTTTRSE